MSTDLQKEFDKATSYELSDHDIERARLMIGVELASKDLEQFQTATIDNIRNFAQSAGSDNPLFCDPEYAKATRWGGVIAPTMMAGILNSPMKGDPLDPELKAKIKGMFRGIHVFVSGGEWKFFKPIYPGDTIFSFRGVVSVDLQPSEFAGRKVNRITRDVKMNQRGEIVATYAYREIMTERKTAAKKGKYLAIEPANYTDADIERIDALYKNDIPRGAEPWYFEDVTVGEKLRDAVSGPLTVTDIVNWHGGGYGWIPYGLRTGRLWHKNRVRIAPFYVKNDMGVPDVAQRLHWDSTWAKAIGNPFAYDYGVMRENYIYRYLTDIAGDNGWVYSQYDEIRKFNYMGDTQFFSTEVVGKRQENGLNLVDLTVQLVNQRGEETVRCNASIALPSKNGMPVVLPEPEPELKAKALQMIARHWELSAKK